MWTIGADLPSGIVREDAATPGKAGKSSLSHYPWKSRKIDRKVVAKTTRSLAVMLKARLSLTDALATAALQTESKGMSDVLKSLEGDVRAGKSFSSALSRHPGAFDALYVNMTEVGEATGFLDDVFLRLSHFLEKKWALRRKIRTALAYPLLVLTVAAGATIFMLAVIVPTFAEMYGDMNAELPALTQWLLSMSSLATEYAFALLATVSAFTFLVYRVRNNDWAIDAKDRVLLKMPILGKLILHNSLAQFCRTLGTLLQNGVPLAKGLDILERSGINRVIHRQIREMQSDVSRGRTLMHRTRGNSMFPPMLVSLIEVGEKAASLDEILLYLANHYEDEVDAMTERLSSMLEPVLIVVIGVVLGVILAALYVPMFELIGAVGMG